MIEPARTRLSSGSVLVMAMLGPLLIAVAASCGQASPPSSGRPSPSPSGSHAPEAQPPGGPVPAQLQGDWYQITTDIPVHVITLTTTQYKLRGGGISSGDVVVLGDEIDFFNAEPCALPLPEGLGRYRWGLSGDVLSLTPLNEDPCPRSFELANQKYRRVPETSPSM